MDFSSVILSVVPLEHFKDFLYKYKREALVFLKVVRIFEQLQELDEDIYELQNDIQVRFTLPKNTLSSEVYKPSLSDTQVDFRKTELIQSFSLLKAKLIRLYLQQPEVFASLKSDQYETVGNNEVPELDSINSHAKNCLEIIFKRDFLKSDEYKKLVLFLHDNMIEFSFWH